jgi:hypothetical protein
MNPARNLIIDLSDASNISSTGLAAIHKIALPCSGVQIPISRTAAVRANTLNSLIRSLTWKERSRARA